MFTLKKGPGLLPRRVETLGFECCYQRCDRDNRFDNQLGNLLGLQPFLFRFFAHVYHLPSMIIVYHTRTSMSSVFLKILNIF